MSSSAAGPAEGWYPDPDDEYGYRRFWDGDAWTQIRGRKSNHPDRVRIRRVATVAGLTGLAVFLLATFLSTSAGGVSCGNWISPSTIYSTSGNVFGTVLANEAAQQCHSQLANRRLIALIALVIGGAVKWGLPFATKQQYDQ